MDMMETILAGKLFGGRGGGQSSFGLVNFENRELSVSTISVIDSSITIEGGSTE